MNASADLVHPETHQGERGQRAERERHIDAEHHPDGQEHHGDQGQPVHHGRPEVHPDFGDVLRNAVHQITGGVLLVKGGGEPLVLVVDGLL